MEFCLGSGDLLALRLNDDVGQVNAIEHRVG